MAGSEPPSRSGVTYSVAVTVRIIGAYDTVVNLAPYLARIGLAPPLPPTLDTLRRLHVAHLGAFTFHNLQIQRGGSVPVDVESLERKYAGPDGGGYCFEQN